MQTASQTKPFQVGSATFGDGRLAIIAGPCVIESEEHAMMMARECAQRARDTGLDFVFKTSFDKANRSSIKSFRGVGMKAGLEILSHIKREVGVPVVTDIHDPAQVDAVAEVDSLPDGEEGVSDSERIITDWAGAIIELGIEVKGLWLIDFDNGSGYYCWQHPEPSLQYFHGYEEGFGGRVKLQ